jgi:hypothetical protein
VTLDTRPGVTLRLALGQPEASPNGTLVLFPGGNGRGHIQTDGAGQLRFSGNFLTRSANLFAAQGFAVAVVGVPSDRATGMNDAFRTSLAHAEDTGVAVEFQTAESLL